MSAIVPRSDEQVAIVRVQSETATERGWRFEIETQRSGASSSRCEVELSWADYEFWSHGRLAPERIARAVVQFLLDRAPNEPLPQRFDASTVRRQRPEIDTSLSEWL